MERYVVRLEAIARGRAPLATSANAVVSVRTARLAVEQTRSVQKAALFRKWCLQGISAMKTKTISRRAQCRFATRVAFALATARGTTALLVGTQMKKAPRRQPAKTTASVGITANLARPVPNNTPAAAPKFIAREAVKNPLQ